MLTEIQSHIDKRNVRQTSASVLDTCIPTYQDPKSEGKQISKVDRNTFTSISVSLGAQRNTQRHR